MYLGEFCWCGVCYVLVDVVVCVVVVDVVFGGGEYVVVVF